MHEVEGMAGKHLRLLGPQQSGAAGRVPVALSRTRLFDLVADCLLNATFSDEELDKEGECHRRHPRAGDNLGASDVPALPFRHVEEAPLSPRSAGTTDSVAGFTRRRLMQHFRRFYAIKNLTCGGGATSILAGVIAKVATLFSGAS